MNIECRQAIRRPSATRFLSRTSDRRLDGATRKGGSTRSTNPARPHTNTTPTGATERESLTELVAVGLSRRLAVRRAAVGVDGTHLVSQPAQTAAHAALDGAFGLRQ